MKYTSVYTIPLAILTLSGCSAPPPGAGTSTATAFSGSSAPVPTRLTLLAVDRSKSTENIRGQLLTTAFDIGTGFDRAHDSFRMYHFGNSIEEVYSQLPEDDDAFALLLVQEVKESDPVPGTDYPRVVEAMATTAEEATESEVRLVIVGDGLNDYATDPQFAQRYRSAAERLSRNPRLKWVRFWGVDVGTREEIRAVFKPLGRKLQILSLDQNPLAP
jgi:uncharacterized protein with von Willebrand factor type A (vWA) domain